MSTLSEALQRLYQRNIHVVKLGLETMEALVQALDRPDQSLLILHVAGTNGKGSVCAMVESVLRKAGFKTGLFTSPHLVRFNERIRVDGQCITDSELSRLMDVVDEADHRVAGVEGARTATFFEYTTALALEYFREKEVQVVVLETGLGGRLDATNVVIPVLSVLTSIGLDHTSYLGDTLAEVAHEKAGIIKEGRPVVCGPMAYDARSVIERVAHQRSCEIVHVPDYTSVHRKKVELSGQKVKVESESASYPPFVLPLHGEHQLANLATAVTALETFAQTVGFTLPEHVMVEGLTGVQWLGRCQVLEEDPLLVIDAAHNVEGARALKQTLKKLAGKKPWGWIVSMSNDKDPHGFFAEVADQVERCWLVPMEVERAMPMEALEAAASSAGLTPTKLSLLEAWEEARAWAAASGGAVVVGGSIYLVGELFGRLNIPCYE